jgi:hypothetical protein
MKTKFELYKSASEAAAKTLELKPFEVASKGMEIFREEKHSPDDWEFWNGTFQERREFFEILKRQPAPSVPAVKKPV